MVRFLLTTLLTTVICDFCSTQCSRQAKMIKNLSFEHDCGYDSRRVLKCVSKY